MNQAWRTVAMRQQWRTMSTCPAEARGGCGYEMDWNVSTRTATCPRCFHPSRVESGWTGGGLLRAAFGTGFRRERVDFPDACRGPAALTHNRQARGQDRD